MFSSEDGFRCDLPILRALPSLYAYGQKGFDSMFSKCIFSNFHGGLPDQRSGSIWTNDVCAPSVTYHPAPFCSGGDSFGLTLSNPPIMLTEGTLKAILPNCKEPGLWCSILNVVMPDFQINSMPRIAAFIAQTAHESREFNVLVENMNYSSVDRIMSIWPKRFPKPSDAKPFVNNPQGIANKVYANRNGNGDEKSGEGWKYRGRGLIQLTGKYNYKAAGLALDLDLEKFPELVESPMIAAMTAAQFWKSHNLNHFADDLKDEHNKPTKPNRAGFSLITKTINAKREGLVNRERYWKAARFQICFRNNK